MMIPAGKSPLFGPQRSGGQSKLARAGKLAPSHVVGQTNELTGRPVSVVIVAETTCQVAASFPGRRANCELAAGLASLRY